MGKHVLELCLSPPHIELPIGRGGRPCVLFPQVSIPNDGHKTFHASWDEAFTVTLSSSHSVVVVSFFIAEPGSHNLHEAHAKGEARFFADTCLPYAGLVELGICADGPPGLLRLALVPGKQYGQESSEELTRILQHTLELFRPDRPWISISLREMAVPTDWSRRDVEWKLPCPKTEIFKLENALLHNRLCAVLPHTIQPEPTPEELSAVPNNRRQLQMVQLENEQLRHEKAGLLQKLENMQTVLSEAGKAVQNSDQDRTKKLQIMQGELDHCQDREMKIKANYEERIQELKTQLQQEKAEIETQVQTEKAAHKLSQEIAAMQERTKQATIRREDLQQQLQTAQEERDRAGDLNAQHSNPDIRRLLAQSKEQKAELAALQQEIALQHEKEAGDCMAQEEELRRKIQLLSEELEELQRLREDERVRNESEVRELRNERDSVKDRLDDATTELQHLHAKAEALQSLHAQALQESAGPARTASDLNRVQTGNERQKRELEHLQKCKEDRTQTIQDLEREQEALVDEISHVTAQVVPSADGCNGPCDYVKGLEAKALELQQQFVRTQCSCEVQRAEVARLKSSTEAAKAQSQALKQSYDAFQQRSDEKMLRKLEQPRYAHGGR